MKFLLLFSAIFYFFAQLGKQDAKESSRKKSSLTKFQPKKNSKPVMDFDKGEYIEYKEVKS